MRYGHPSTWDWGRTATSLGLCQRYATLTPVQRATHNAFAATQDCPRKLYDVLPAETRAAIDEHRRRQAYRENAPVLP